MKARQSTFKENYEHVLMNEREKKFVAAGGKLTVAKMNEDEEAWARAFEELLYAEQRGKIHDAVDAFVKLTSRAPKEAEVAKINANIQMAISSNPTRAEAKAKDNKKRGMSRGIRAPKSSMYDASDYVRVMPGKVNKDDLGFEAAYSKDEITQVFESDDGHVEHAKLERFIKVEAGLNPDETSVMVNPEDGMIDAIDLAKSKGRSLEKLIEDAKLSKEAQEVLKEKAQTFSYGATVYTFHGRQYMNLNYVLVAQDGSEWVQDQHGRLARLALYLKRETSDSFATHCEIYYPDTPVQVWIFEAAKRSNIEGKAIQWKAM